MKTFNEPRTIKALWLIGLMVLMIFAVSLYIYSHSHANRHAVYITNNSADSIEVIIKGPDGSVTSKIPIIANEKKLIDAVTSADKIQYEIYDKSENRTTILRGSELNDGSESVELFYPPK